MLHNWRCVFWIYLLNLIFGLLSGIPLSAGMASYLDHSLASSQIAGNLDAAYLGELALHLSRSHLLTAAARGAGWLTAVEFVALILLVGGTLRIYLAGEPPRLPVLLARGSEYFWRMVRVSLLSAIVTGLILAGLMAARGALLERLNQVYVERTMFLYAASSAAVVLLVALLLRLWFDLVEVYSIRNGALGNRRILRAVLPALRILLGNFWRAFGSFLLIGLLGAGALAACFFVWKDLIPANQVWLAALVAQLGLLLFLAARYWQRAIEVALVAAAELPLSIPAPSERVNPQGADAPPPAGLADPTLRDLVLKLQKEPLANPQTVSPPNSALFPETSWPGATPSQPRPPQDLLLEEHAKKVPLPGAGAPASTEPDSPSNGDKDKDGGEAAKTDPELAVPPAEPRPINLRPGDSRKKK
jgi:hypothetical protein